MKHIIFTSFLLLGFFFSLQAQTGRQVHGVVIDSTKQTLPGSTIKLTSEANDNVSTSTDVNGKFVFPAVKGNKLTLTISSIGYQSLIKHYTLENDGQPADVGDITLRSESRQLNAVTIVGEVTPVTLKEDTVEYKASAYKVRANSPVEDQLKRIPGVDVDAQGNVSAQGKQITRVRINGKDFFGGDVQTATKNLPADLVDSYQVVDDYGDQANLTGIRTGDAQKILNITIRKDKNYGYSAQGTFGDGSDALPKNKAADGTLSNANNDNRYIANINAFKFNNDQQIAILGTLNNTNANTFSFGGNTGGNNRGSFSGGGGFGGGGGGGGGRGGNARGFGTRNSSGQTTNQNGITNVRTIGGNFRDQWGKHVSFYGSYSFADNTTNSLSNELRQNNTATPTTSTTNSNQTNESINHRLNFNVEYRPDTINYLKITPQFSYTDNRTVSAENVFSTRDGVPNLAYTSNSTTNSSSPDLSLDLLYNHRFSSRGRNLSISGNIGTTKNYGFDNPVYVYDANSASRLNIPVNQFVNSYNKSTNTGVSLSYIEPLSKVSFLELNYAYNHTSNRSDNLTDTLLATNITSLYRPGTNNYDYTFTTNRFGLNYRFIETKYNFVLGVGVQPSVLEGNGQSFDLNERPFNNNTKINRTNFIPSARFSYNFSRGKELSFNYRGRSNQPTYTQLSPTYNLANALYPTLGNPNLLPEFENSFSLRYNKFSFETGNIFFTNFSFTQTDQKIVSNIITYPAPVTRTAPGPFGGTPVSTTQGGFTPVILQQDPGLRKLQGTQLTTYLNADGYYQGNANILFSKPWSQRKYTLVLNGNFTYTNNIGYSSTVDINNVMSALVKNVAKNFDFTPQVRFRANVLDVIDLEARTSYGFNKTDNSDKSNINNRNTDVRTLILGLTGKNYFFKDYTLSYDFSRTVNYGYDIAVVNPNILNLYVERRFLKQNAGSVRLQAFDVFNQNTGFSVNAANNIVTQTQTNRLGRYFLLSFTMRLQKFAGRAPGGDNNNGRGPGGGNNGGRGGFGGGPGGAPMM